MQNVVVGNIACLCININGPYCARGKKTTQSKYSSFDVYGVVEQ